MASIICVKCGQVAPRTGPVQKYCGPCSEARDLERKRMWSRAHPTPPEKYLPAARARKSSARVAGAAISKENASTIFWFTEEPDLVWLVKVAAPFSYALSKNHLFTTTKNGHIFLRRESRANRDSLCLLLREAMRGRAVANNKLWIDILVQKPDHRGDAVNILDSVCDAIKAAIPLDDRWYCIRRLDWQIVKTDPQIFVGIGQETEVSVYICSYCGQRKEREYFSRNKQTPTGVARECRDCKQRARIDRKAARVAKKALEAPRV